MERRYPSRPIVGVGAVIVIRGEVVLVRRARDPLAGRWSLPGGAVEAGEPLAVALAREVLEETGLDVEVGDLVDVLDRIYTDATGRVEYHYVLADFLCRPRGGHLQAGSDVTDAIAVAPAALDAYALPADTRRVIERGLAMVGEP
jgi:ADP-ribose pyrophosphatase YjhB (NUDIX family)